MKDELKILFQVTESLRSKYDRGFPLDGRLVGDIGEALAERDYYIKLYPQNNSRYDAYEIDTGRKIQIKASMKYYFYFPYDHCSDYFLALHINEDSSLEEIYNGKGKTIHEYLLATKRKPYKKSYYTISGGVLRKLNAVVLSKDRIKKDLEK